MNGRLHASASHSYAGVIVLSISRKTGQGPDHAAAEVMPLQYLSQTTPHLCAGQSPPERHLGQQLFMPQRPPEL